MSDLSTKCRSNIETGAVWGNTTIRALCDEVELLEQRIRELTEWRPMETAPVCEWILIKSDYPELPPNPCLCKVSANREDIYIIGDGDKWVWHPINCLDETLVGWLPLPEVK